MNAKPVLSLILGLSALSLLAPGQAFAGESGDPHASRHETRELRRKSPGLMAGGIVLVSLGSISTILGAAALIGQDQSQETCQGSSNIVVETGGDPFDCSTDPTTTIVGASLLVGGSGLLAGGIPMIVIGKQLVPDEEPSESVEISLAPVRAGAGVAVRAQF